MSGLFGSMLCRFSEGWLFSWQLVKWVEYQKSLETFEAGGMEI